MGSPVATLRTGAIGNPTGRGAALALPPPTQPAESATRATAERTAPIRRRVSAERRNKVGETVTGGFHPGGARRRSTYRTSRSRHWLLERSGRPCCLRAPSAGVGEDRSSLSLPPADRGIQSDGRSCRARTACSSHKTGASAIRPILESPI